MFIAKRWETVMDPRPAGQQTEEKRVCGRGERCWITSAAAKDVHNVLVAIYSQA